MGNNTKWRVIEMDKKTKKEKFVWLHSMNIGFFGGIIWSGLFQFMHTFKMVEVDPQFLFKAIVGPMPWVEKWYAHVLSIIVYGVISIFVALIYYFLFKKKKDWFIGGIYGVLLWVIIYYVAPVLLVGFNPFIHFTWQTHIGIFCLFILYGVFVGYSISYHFESVHIQAEAEA